MRTLENPIGSGETSFRLMFLNNPLPMWVYARDTLEFLEVNEAAIAGYGYSRDEFLRMRITDIRPPEDVPRLLEVVAKERPPLQFSGEWKHRRKDGRLLDVIIQSHTIEFAGRSAVLVVAQDITERKRAEEQLQEARIELERRVQERTAALEESQAALHKSREELRLLAARLLTAQEEDRRHLSRELHDDVNQKLAMLAVDVESMEHKFPALPQSTREQLRLLRNRVVDLSDHVHRLAYQLHPSILDDLGLSIALRSYVDDFAKREGIRVKFIHRNMPELLDQKIATCLYRIAQESLWNVAKHAGAKNVSVKITGSQDAISLSIKDDGDGFDPESLRNRGGGLGIVSMKERVRLVNGEFIIQSTPGGGTQVRVRVPLQGSLP